MFCPKCGSECADSDSFCPKCGEVLPLTTIEETIETTENPNGTETTIDETIVGNSSAPSSDATPSSGEALSVSATPIPVESISVAPVAAAANASSQTASQVGTDTAHTSSAQETASTAGQSSSTASAAQPAQPYATASSSSQPQSAYVPPEPVSSTPTAQSFYAKGCVATAWDDIKGSEGWFGKTLLLGLIMIVPILNWIVAGYCMRWARQLPLGKIESMPKDIFGSRNFINGVYQFVLSLVFGIVGGIAATVLGFIPILGWIAGIAIAIFMNIFLYVAIIRTAIADRLGAGFDISQIWQSSKDNLVNLFIISFVPSLVIGLIVGLIGFFVMLIAVFAVSGDIASMMYTYNAYSYSDLYYYPDLGSVFAIIGMLIPATLLVYVIGCFAQAFIILLTYRAMGHWAARYASGWMNDPTITATAFLNQ